MTLEGWFNRQVSQGRTYTSIARDLYPDVGSNAARKRLERVRKAGFAEDRIVTERAETAYTTTGEATDIIPYWGGTEGAIREDRITWDELDYLSKAGRSDTRKFARKEMEKIIERSGLQAGDPALREGTHNRPLIYRTIGGERISWRFGRGKSDAQIDRVKRQLREKGVSWNETYSDLGGYMGA